MTQEDEMDLNEQKLEGDEPPVRDDDEARMAVPGEWVLGRDWLGDEPEDDQ